MVTLVVVRDLYNGSRWCSGYAEGSIALEAFHSLEVSPLVDVEMRDLLLLESDRLGAFVSGGVGERASGGRVARFSSLKAVEARGERAKEEDGSVEVSFVQSLRPRARKEAQTDVK